MPLEQYSVFTVMQLREAYQFAIHPNHIAIHLHHIVFDSSPGCFKRDVKRGIPIAHVLGTDAEQLRRIGRRHGVKITFIDNEGYVPTAQELEDLIRVRFQHLDMCGSPLKKLLASIGSDINLYTRKPGE